MTNFLNKIKEIINKNLNPEHLSIIDNSYLHSKHKSFDSEKLHLKLIIKSKKMQSMSKIEAHRLIFSILKSEIKSKIHALEIEIQ